MNDKRTNPGEENHEMDEVGRVIRFAGARDAVPVYRLENARARVGDHWEKVVASERRRKNRVIGPLIALAASIAVAIGVGFYALGPYGLENASDRVTISRVTGTVRIDGQAVAAGMQVAAGATIETGASSYVAMELPTGHSLRVDALSQLVASTQQRFALSNGAVYVDSGALGARDSLRIDTPFGTAVDVGTQFEVRLFDQSVRVGVREGLVNLHAANGSAMPIENGQLFELDVDGVETMRPVAPDDSMWGWTQEAAPEFDINRATLSSYLTWYAREKGVELRWEGDDSAIKAGKIVLDGSISGMSLDDGLRVVARIAPFNYRLSDGVLTVSVD